MNQFTRMLQTEVKSACRTPFRLCAFTKGFDRLDYSRWNGLEEPSEQSGAGFKVGGALIGAE